MQPFYPQPSTCLEYMFARTKQQICSYVRSASSLGVPNRQPLSRHQIMAFKGNLCRHPRQTVQVKGFGVLQAKGPSPPHSGFLLHPFWCFVFQLCFRPRKAAGRIAGPAARGGEHLGPQPCGAALGRKMWQGSPNQP